MYNDKLGNNCQITSVFSLWGNFLIWPQSLNNMFLHKFFLSKNISFLGPNPIIASITIDPHMVVIQVHVGKKHSGRHDIIIEDLTKKLRLPTPRLIPYNTFRILNQTFNKLVGLIRNFKFHIHGISYIVIFIVMKKNVLNVNYSMLFRCPWLHNIKATHDWVNNMITIEGNGIMWTIAITKHLNNNTKCSKLFLCYH